MIKIVQKENDVLRQIAKEIPFEKIKSAKIQNVIKKLKQAVMEREEAVAAAAPQIGESLRIFVVSEYVLSSKIVTIATKSDFVATKPKNDYGFMVFVNPKIIKKSKEQKMLTEGCLSVENIYGAIKRSEKIKVEAYDENGKKFIKSGAGLFSQAIQHEIEHLDGILFIDKTITLSKLPKTPKE